MLGQRVAREAVPHVATDQWGAKIPRSASRPVPRSGSSPRARRRISATPGSDALENRQGRAGGRKRSVNDRSGRSGGGVPSRGQFFPELIQELTMADLAFVVTTIAVFALVALVAKGVAKL
jgi:hypothetical protein